MLPLYNKSCVCTNSHGEHCTLVGQVLLNVGYTRKADVKEAKHKHLAHKHAISQNSLHVLLALKRK